MDGPGKRLERAIERQVGNVRKFERDLKKAWPKVRGGSRQSLYRYFSGRGEPPAAVIAAAAEYLGVREEWLLTGAGGMTPEEDRLLKAQEAAALRGENDTDPLRTILEEAASEGGLDLLGTFAPAAAFTDLCLRWRGRQPLDRDEDLDGIGAMFGHLITGPLEELGIRGSPYSEEFRDYVVAMCQALLLAMRIPQRPTAEENTDA